MLYPTPLSPGDRVALVGPSGPVPPERVQPAVDAVKALGLEPVLYPSATAAHGYLAGEDRQRAQDLTDAFLDGSIQGILCIRGGYGAQRMLPCFQPEAAISHPKVFCGYSDVTAIHLLLNQTGEGLVTFHTPMPSTEWYKGLDGYTMQSMKGLLFCPWSQWKPLENAPGSPPPEVIVPGEAFGTLRGGNLSLVASSIATPWEVDTNGAVLFLEDVGERPYRLDGMLTHLRNSGRLERCAAVLLGYFTDCQAEDPARSLTIPEVIREVVEPVCRERGIPLVAGLTCGHSLPTMSLPLGSGVLVQAGADGAVALKFSRIIGEGRAVVEIEIGEERK